MVKERQKLKERLGKAHLLIWNCVVDILHASNQVYWHGKYGKYSTWLILRNRNETLFSPVKLAMIKYGGKILWKEYFYNADRSVHVYNFSGKQIGKIL